MSRAYRIRVAESLRRTRTVEDHVESRLGVLAILPPDRMGELVGAALAERGFTVAGGKAVLRDGAIEIEVDLASMDVVARVQGESTVDLHTEVDGTIFNPDDAAEKAQVVAGVRSGLERAAAAKDEEVRKVLSGELEAALVKVQPVLDAAVDAALRAALRERAAQMGEVQEVHEDAATGEMTIRIKV
jgi:FtsH ternary system domain X5